MKNQDKLTAKEEEIFKNMKNTVAIAFIMALALYIGEKVFA